MTGRTPHAFPTYTGAHDRHELIADTRAVFYARGFIGMTDDDDDDSLCDTSFNGIGYALQVEMLDEVTRAAWRDAEELKKAAAKRPGRKQTAK